MKKDIKTTVENFIRKRPSQRERAKILTTLITLYIQVTNNLNKNLELELKDVAEILKEMGAKKDELKREEVRATIL